MSVEASGVTMASDAALSARVLDRLAPLVECSSEGAGWIHVVEIARDLLHADFAVAMEFIDDDRTRLLSGTGYDDLAVGIQLPAPPGSHAAWSRDTAGVTVSDDLLTETRFTPNPLIVRDGMRSSMSIRLEMPDGTVAAVGAHSRTVGRFGPDVVRLFGVLGGIFQESIGRLRSWDAMELNARIDALTGTMNRASILEHLRMQFDGGGQPSVLLIDIDGFKAVNDSHGHRIGDTVLRTITERLERSLRPDDRLGRLGGDEFLLVTTGSDETREQSLAEQLIGHVEETIMVGTHAVQVSASVGIARRRAGDDEMSLLERSDRLMYAAKSAGRGEVRADHGHDPAVAPEPAPNATGPLPTTAKSVDSAIAGVRTVVQPIIDARTGRVHGIEALARGPVGHPLEMPDRLFPAAQTFSRLGDLELEAKRQAFSFDLDPTTMLYVNLEPILLSSESWMAELTAAWRECGAHPSVTIELTERAVLRSPGRLLRAVDVCREHGWKIALDDVGSRSESLAGLRWIDPDVVKLDMGLIASSTSAHAAHVTAAVQAYRASRPDRPIRIIAEGVEDADDARTGDVLGADLLQGYLFGRPMSLDELRRNDPEKTSPRVAAPRRVEGDRTATVGELLNLTRHIESSVMSSDFVVVASIQHANNLSDRTARQYESLAKRCGFVGLVGVEVNDANVPHLRGVRLAELDPSDPVRADWHVIALSPAGSIALLATELEASPSMHGLGRRFRYRLATDAADVERHARRLLRYF